MATSTYGDGCAFIDGKYLPIAEARIPILDTGFTRSDLTYDVVAVWQDMFGADILMGAEEVFITSTAGGVIPVVTVNGRTIGDGKPGKITTLIQKRYWESHEEGQWVTAVEYPE